MVVTIGKSFGIVLFTVFATFNSFYSPQPLLPLISELYQVSPTRSALLLTIPFVLLCVSPVFYGALLNSINARIVLIIATLILAATQAAFAIATSFQELIASRTIQAFLYPAIFTASVTYCSKAGPEANVARRVSFYVASTIVGGLCGRLLSGFVTSHFGWNSTFTLNTVSLLLCALLLYFAAEDKISTSKTKNITMVGKILSNRTFLSGYLLIFTTFFAFSATLNALPFRLVELEPGISPAKISLVYSGYILGVLVAGNNQMLCRWAGGRVQAMTIALSGLLIAIVLLTPGSITWLIGMSFITASCMFMIHSTLSGFLTGLMPAQSSLINGLYISIYYAAGALGSILPLWVYHYGGWKLFLVTIFMVAITGFITLRRLASHATN